MYSGEFISATLPKLTAAAVVTVPSTAQVTGRMPEMTAAVAGVIYAGAAVTASMPRITSAGWNYIGAGLPRMRALASNDASYSVTVAYAVTLTNKAKPVTRYTNYPFQSIVRFGNDYIGFGPIGAVKLAGADDAGTPIAWSFTFGDETRAADSRAGPTVYKTNSGVYFSGRFAGATALTVKVDDGSVYTYNKVVLASNRDTLRFVPGRGLLGFSWRFGLSGVGAMDLYRAEFIQRSLSRKVKHA
jgi:hypothetical protein